MYDIPSDPTIVKVTVTGECVRNNTPPELTRNPNRTQRPKLGKATVRQIERPGRREHDRGWAG